MDNEHSIENTKKYAIMEVMFFNGYTVGMQSFVLLSLAIYFNMSSFFISIDTFFLAGLCNGTTRIGLPLKV